MSQIQVSGKNFLTVSVFFLLIVSGSVLSRLFVTGMSSMASNAMSSYSVNMDNKRKKNTQQKNQKQIFSPSLVRLKMNC